MVWIDAMRQRLCRPFVSGPGFTHHALVPATPARSASCLSPSSRQRLRRTARSGHVHVPTTSRRSWNGRACRRAKSLTPIDGRRHGPEDPAL